MDIATYIILGAAVVLMGWALVGAVRLMSVARGGKIGTVVRLLVGFIALFFAMYGAAPFLFNQSKDLAVLMTASVFFFGAVFVIIVIRIIRSLIAQVFKELDL